MWKLFKSEVAYYKTYLLMILLMPIGFALGLEYGFKLLTGVDFIAKYSWSILVGIGSYAFILIIWMVRHSEKRSRQQVILPVSIKSLAFARFALMVLPFVYVIIVLYLAYYFYSAIIGIQLFRILSQLGMVFMFACAYLLVNDIWNLWEDKLFSKRIARTLLLSILVVAGTIIMVFKMIIPFYKSSIGSNEELVFFAWGLILLLISNLVFGKRSTYLE